MSQKTSILRILCYSNYFYGFCAVALTIEATLQQKFPLNNPFYYLFIFCATVFFYSKPYLSARQTSIDNQRTMWYAQYKKHMHMSQTVFAIYMLLYTVWFTLYNIFYIFNAEYLNYVLICVFPLIGVLYYGINHPSLIHYNLRKIGFLKPFIIGLVWAGVVTVYPVLFYNMANALPYAITLLGCLLFLKNCMFISVLCIMFDIKDHAADSSIQLNTFIVKSGLRTTIFYIILPLSFLGLATFFVYSLTHGFSPVKIILNTIPFIGLIVVGLSLRRRRELLYYLTIVDGLMLLKAVCGTIAMVWF